jgi:hypothetical protein
MLAWFFQFDCYDGKIARLSNLRQAFFLLSRSWFGIKPEAKGNVISIGSAG